MYKCNVCGNVCKKYGNYIKCIGCQREWFLTSNEKYEVVKR